LCGLQGMCGIVLYHGSVFWFPREDRQRCRLAPCLECSAKSTCIFNQDDILAVVFLRKKTY
jgi:hypothetical protein